MKPEHTPSMAAGKNLPVPKWGTTGHTWVNKLSALALPADLQGFYLQYLDEIVRHAMDADKDKATNPAERPHHYINIDLYGPPPFSALPEDYQQAVEKFGLQTVVGRGIVPWWIETTYNKLVEAFKSSKLAAVLKHAAYLGHYVGDAHVPFHVTANHDGQITGQKGIHEYFESRLLDTYIKPDEIIPAKAKPITKPPHNLAFGWVRESHSYVQPLLDADAANGGKKGRRNLAGFAKTAKPIAVERLSKACTRTASLWYSAWLAGGKPDVTTFSKKPAKPMLDHRALL